EKKGEIAPPDVVIVDPPRSGLDPKAVEQLLELLPPTIAYVSCNPETQAKNVTELVANGYTLQHIQPVYQFPHTPHVENIAIVTQSAELKRQRCGPHRGTIVVSSVHIPHVPANLAALPQLAY